MFYHVVLLKFSDANPQFLSRVNGFADRIRAELPYVRDYYFGPNTASRAAQFDWAVVGAFDDEVDHERYQASDVHQEMKAFLYPNIAEIVVCDVGTPGGVETR